MFHNLIKNFMKTYPGHVYIWGIQQTSFCSLYSTLAFNSIHLKNSNSCFYFLHRFEFLRANCIHLFVQWWNLLSKISNHHPYQEITFNSNFHCYIECFLHFSTISSGLWRRSYRCLDNNKNHQQMFLKHKKSFQT